MKRLFLAFAICFCAIVILPVSARSAGDCGENMTWEIDSAAGVLTISGQGEMDTGGYSPWWDYRKTIKKVVISEGVTSICDRAFSGHMVLEEVVLPKSVCTIERNAFNGCRQLASIDITNVTYIGEYAFSQCAIKELRIPAGITKVGYAAFSSCAELKSLILHEGVTEIETNAFSGCMALTSVYLPDSVRVLGGSAFSGCSNLTDIRLNEGLQIISNSAFSGCYRLEQVTIPDTVREIQSYAFSGCKNLKSVYIGAGVSSVDVMAFAECRALSAFTLCDKNRDLWVHNGVLYSGDKKQLLLMPEGFSGEYSIPAGTTTIGERACYSSGITAVTIPGSVVEIGKYAFAGCTTLQKTDLQNGLQIIRESAFTRTNISEITIPGSVKEIQGMAFASCAKLGTVRFEGEPPQIRESAFMDVRATVYRPANSGKWLEAEKLYGGYLYWESVGECAHRPVAKVMIPPGCISNGMLGPSQCSYCGLVLEGPKEIPPEGHKFSKWVEMKPATTDQEGLAQRMCSVCDIIEQKKLNKLPQIIPSEPVTLPTEEPVITEPVATIEPDELPSVESKPAESSVPPDTEDIYTMGAAETESVEQIAPKGSGSSEWGVIVLGAIVSLFVGFCVVGLILRNKKRQ